MTQGDRTGDRSRKAEAEESAQWCQPSVVPGFTTVETELERAKVRACPDVIESFDHYTLLEQAAPPEFLLQDLLDELNSPVWCFKNSRGSRF